MRKLSKFKRFWLNKAKILLVAIVVAFNLPIHSVSAAWNPDDVSGFIGSIKPETMEMITFDLGTLAVTGKDSVVSSNVPAVPKKTVKVIITAYSSTPDQTDDTPFITASGKHVRDGIVAANFLEFGTKVKIPAIFGDKVFTVEDRMARKHDGKMDIWFPERSLAKRFGVRHEEIVILD